MDSTTYGVMILAPVIYWILKISLSWRIYKTALRENHSRTYINSHKGNFIKSYFAWNFREELKFILFISNFIMGLILLISVPISIFYFVLYIFKYSLRYSNIGTITAYFIIALWSIHIILLVNDKLSKLAKKK